MVLNSYFWRVILFRQLESKTFFLLLTRLLFFCFRTKGGFLGKETGAVEGPTVLFLLEPEGRGCAVGKEKASAAVAAPAAPVVLVRLLQPERTVVVQTDAS